VSAAYGSCTAFSPTGCPMTATTTPDGNGGNLIVVGVQVTGDGYQAIVFFDGTMAVGQAGASCSRPFRPQLRPLGTPRYSAITASGPGKLEVSWSTWSKSNFAGFCCPNGPPMTWAYQWDGNSLQASGPGPPPGYEF
jgi:hypothetical protein